MRVRGKAWEDEDISDLAGEPYKPGGRVAV